MATATKNLSITPAEAAYLAELKASKRPILRQYCLQRASNDLPPGALTQLYLHLPAIGGRALCKMAPEYKYMTARARRRAAKRPQLEKQSISGGHTYYTTPIVSPAQKTLYIIFSGHVGQFFIPFSVLMSLLPDGPKDVVAVRSTLEQFFVGHVEGLGPDVFTVATALREKFQTDTYARVVVMGVSAGGIFSLRVADFLAADIAVSFAGVYLDEGFRLKMAVNAGATAFDPICACRPSNTGRIVNVLASKNEYDLLCSQRLKKMRPSLLEFHLVNVGQHNVLKPMLNAGYARGFIRAALAKNGALIWLMSTLSKAYGLFVVRGIRRAFGMQKIGDWYVAHKVDADQKDD